MTAAPIRDFILALLVLSESIHWYKRYRWPSKFASVRGKLAECSKCHRRVSNWQQRLGGVVCANCAPGTK